MKRVLLARLAPLIERLGHTGSYRAIPIGRDRALIYVRLRDPNINTDDWERKPGE